jgi:hypothetical protein
MGDPMPMGLWLDFLRSRVFLNAEFVELESGLARGHVSSPLDRAELLDVAAVSQNI